MFCRFDFHCRVAHQGILMRKFGAHLVTGLLCVVLLAVGGGCGDSGPAKAKLYPVKGKVTGAKPLTDDALRRLHALKLGGCGLAGLFTPDSLDPKSLAPSPLAPSPLARSPFALTFVELDLFWTIICRT